MRTVLQRLLTARASSARCQKCEGFGHYSFECKQEPVYKRRPTRTEILKKPKLAPKLSETALSAEADANG